MLRVIGIFFLLFSRPLFCCALPFCNWKEKLEHKCPNPSSVPPLMERSFTLLSSPQAADWHPVWRLGFGFPTLPEKQGCQKKNRTPESQSSASTPNPSFLSTTLWLRAASAHQGPLGLWIMKARWVCPLVRTDQLRPECWRQNKGFPLPPLSINVNLKIKNFALWTLSFSHRRSVV